MNIFFLIQKMMEVEANIDELVIPCIQSLFYLESILNKLRKNLHASGVDAKETEERY